MRYIAIHKNLELLSTDGKVRHSFTNGVLTVGDNTTKTGAGNDMATNFINNLADGTTQQVELLSFFATDLLGNDTIIVEEMGLGSLSGKDYAGASLSTLIGGYRGGFFEAPVLTGSVDDASAFADARYIVLSGSVIYNGTTYTTGQTFVTVLNTPTVTGTGTFALTIPRVFETPCACNQTEYFKQRVLQVGDESSDYWSFAGGANPRDSQVSSATDFFGWLRH